MEQVKKIATRDSYGKALAELGVEHENIVVLDADLANATKTLTFQKAFPDRHYDCGIAEADMMCVAAGLSTTGLVPFVSSFAMFAAGRAFEQVRNSIGYPHLNVKIGATHGGISVGEDGASHPNRGPMGRRYGCSSGRKTHEKISLLPELPQAVGNRGVGRIHAFGLA